MFRDCMTEIIASGLQQKTMLGSDMRTAGISIAECK